ncbi:MAG: dockerin type I repeat-containing protein [Clostridia bacterium]|nr:dockerin type I repeat-containing protein [Clostridia bacterium]
MKKILAVIFSISIVMTLSLSVFASDHSEAYKKFEDILYENYPGGTPADPSASEVAAYMEYFVLECGYSYNYFNNSNAIGKMLILLNDSESGVQELTLSAGLSGVSYFFERMYSTALGKNCYSISFGDNIDLYAAYSELTLEEKIYASAKIYTLLKNNADVTVFFDPLIGGDNPDAELLSYDVNFDGVYNIADLAHLKAYISGIEDRVNFIAADRDGNGAVNLADISEFKAALAG